MAIITKILTNVGQTAEKTQQNASLTRPIYLLFTRKSEGSRWRRMWRLAAGACAVPTFEISTLGPASPRVICARTRKKLAGTTLDELVQWMVQDASLDR